MDERTVTAFRCDRAALHDLARQRNTTVSALLRDLIDRERRRQMRRQMKETHTGGASFQTNTASAQPS